MSQIKPKLLFFMLLCLSFGWRAGQSQVTVSGKIFTPEGLPVEGVTVSVSGSSSADILTNANGEYSFSLPAGGDYSIQPQFDAEPLQAITTCDLVLLSKYVLGTQVFTSPYQILATDVNGSGSVTTMDLVVLKNYLLFLEPFPNDKYWIFIPADFVFPNPLNPYATAIPTIVNFNNLTTDQTDVDWIGVQIGNVCTDLSGGVENLAVLQGNIVFDENENCLADTSELPLSQWIITAENGAGEGFFTFSKLDGSFDLLLPPGEYDLQIATPNDLWDACVDTFQNVQADSGDVLQFDFPVQATVLCPSLEVELATPFLRRCFESNYFVNYCNTGTSVAEDAYVEVAFDSFLTVTGSSLPWSQAVGNTYVFDLGDLPPGACGDFSVQVEVSCDAVLGQTHCSSAHIFPDTLCISDSLWSGGDLEVLALCVGDSIVFTVVNHGEDMDEPVEFVVIEDVMIQFTGELELQAGGSQTFTVPANGSTWRLRVLQVPGHPWSEWQSAAVEGCGTNPGGTFSLGFFNQFSMDDDEPFFDQDCRENMGAYDPNDKQGFPQGVGDEHVIEHGQAIDYLVRFQNTGTDTAFSVLVTDTLSPLFDPATLKILGGSHPFELLTIGNGVLNFIFPNIMLPDSNVNEPASHGFVKFRIEPRLDLPLGTAVENEAAIFFDFNEAVVTNRTRHVLGELFFAGDSTQAFVENLRVEVFPNPFEASATLRLVGLDVKNGRLKIFDGQGKLVQAFQFSGNEAKLDGKSLAAGLYFFQLAAEGKVVAAGKFMVKK